jgi:predicted RNA binding protein YcfA (HicA-like mRNA interferase family)
VNPITGPELCKRLEKAGWRLQRVKGSHYIFSKPDERKIISVPVHGNHEVKPGLAKRIARDTGIAW